MLPIGPLMVEHRLIERGIALINQEAKRLAAGDPVDPERVSALVDFVRIYADRTHHGKEEGILFRDLAKRAMTAGDRRSMQELVKEHATARHLVLALVAATERHLEGEADALPEIVDSMRALADLYSGHIAQEDKVFFPASMTYFDRDEQDAMIAEMNAFDRQMIHSKYGATIALLEEAPATAGEPKALKAKAVGAVHDDDVIPETQTEQQEADKGSEVE